MIKAVLFDYGGVLSSGGQHFEAVLADMLGVTIEALNIGDLRKQLMSGTLNTHDFFEELSRREGHTITPDEFQEASGIFGINKAVFILVKRIRAAGLKTAVLSNMYQSTADELRKKGVYDGFDPVVLSYETGTAKPDPAIYELAINKLGCKPQEVLFIDDQERFLVPARELGIQTIRAVDEAQIVTDVTAILKKENKLEL